MMADTPFIYLCISHMGDSPKWVKSKKRRKNISSSYAKILGEKLFRTWEIPRSGSKAKNGEKKEKKRKKERRKKEERLNNGENNGQAKHGARKHTWRTQAAWAKISNFKTDMLERNIAVSMVCEVWQKSEDKQHLFEVEKMLE